MVCTLVAVHQLVWAGYTKTCCNTEWTIVDTASCAPEVVAGNLAATDRVLHNFLSDPRASKKFKDEVSSALSEENLESKVSKLFTLVGVDTPEQMATFIDPKADLQPYVQAALDKLEISADFSQEVASTLKQELRGGLQ